MGLPAYTQTSNAYQRTLEEYLSEAESRIYLFGGSVPLIRATIDAYWTTITSTDNLTLGEEFSAENPLTIITSSESTLNEVFRDYKTAAKGADLAESLTLMDTTHGTPSAPVFVTEQSAHVPVSLSDEIQLFAADDQPHEEILLAAQHSTDAGRKYTITTPGYTENRTSLAETFSQPVVDTFTELFSTASTLHPKKSAVDIGIIMLVAGAAGGELEIDIREWCSSRNIIAANPLRSRRDTLKEHGILHSVKQPGNPGRPPLKLVLDDEFKKISAPEIHSRLCELLTAVESRGATQVYCTRSGEE